MLQIHLSDVALTTQEKKRCSILPPYSEAAREKQQGVYAPGFHSVGEGDTSNTDTQNFSSQYEETNTTYRVHGSSLKSFAVRYIKIGLSIKNCSYLISFN